MSAATRAVGIVSALSENEARYLRRRVRYLLGLRKTPPSGYSRMGISMERSLELDAFAATFVEA